LDDPENQSPHQNAIIRRQHITNKQRQDIYEVLLARSKMGFYTKIQQPLFQIYFMLREELFRTFGKK